MDGGLRDTIVLGGGTVDSGVGIVWIQTLPGKYLNTHKRKKTKTKLYIGITDQSPGLKGAGHMNDPVEDADLEYYRAAFRSSLLWAFILVCVITLIIILC